MLMNRGLLATSRASAPRTAVASRGITSVSALSKSDVAELLAEQIKMEKPVALDAVSALLSIITTKVAAGEDITFVGFGSFKCKQREARKGRNPKTGEELDIPPKKAVSFSAGKQLKEAVNGIIATPRAKPAPKGKPATSAKEVKAKSAAAPSSPKPVIVAPASKAPAITSKTVPKTVPKKA